MIEVDPRIVPRLDADVKVRMTYQIDNLDTGYTEQTTEEGSVLVMMFDLMDVGHLFHMGNPAQNYRVSHVKAEVDI